MSNYISLQKSNMTVDSYNRHDKGRGLTECVARLTVQVTDFHTWYTATNTGKRPLFNWIYKWMQRSERLSELQHGSSIDCARHGFSHVVCLIEHLRSIPLFFGRQGAFPCQEIKCINESRGFAPWVSITDYDMVKVLHLRSRVLKSANSSGLASQKSW